MRIVVTLSGLVKVFLVALAVGVILGVRVDAKSSSSGDDPKLDPYKQIIALHAVPGGPAR